MISATSKGSLYFHFADLADLIEQALLERFTARAWAVVELAETLFVRARTAVEAREILITLLGLGARLRVHSYGSTTRSSSPTPLGTLDWGSGCRSSRPQ